jgi:serine/threonine protein phosphatase PrpC
MATNSSDSGPAGPDPRSVPFALPVDPPGAPAEVPLALPVLPDAPTGDASPALPAPVAAEPPLAIPVAEIEVSDAALADLLPIAEAVPIPEQVPLTPPSEVASVLQITEAAQVTPAAVCSFCRAPRAPGQTFCENCGLVACSPFEMSAAASEHSITHQTALVVRERYELGEIIAQQGEVTRYRGVDKAAENETQRAVTVVRAPIRTPESPPPAAEIIGSDDSPDEEVLWPSFDEPSRSLPATEPLPGKPTWPSLAWEEGLLAHARHPALPFVLDSFVEGEWQYLVEDRPVGQPLWDAWDDPEATAEQRFGWLVQIADGLRRLHQADAIVGELPPEKIVITSDGSARLTDVGGVLPLPLPAEPILRGTLFSAPELLAHTQTDARADLYHMGALLYALHVGRELAEMDFERPGIPKPFLPQFPDAHPVFGRLLSKTFCAEQDRFPTDEALNDDSTGFSDLIRALQLCQRTLDYVRLEMAAWTTTGMVRTGNEDAFAFLHAVESRQDDLGEAILVLLADGLGGYEAGEVAATLAIQVMRKYLLQQPMFALLAGHPVTVQAPFDLEQCQEHFRAALKEANREVYHASRTGLGRHGMGCTAEVVYVNGRHVVVGHVGDSRTYHLHEGRLLQVTRDQTLVTRLVELGVLTPDEAATDARRSELQQAIGGRVDVDPAVFHGRLKPRDWVIVCSDGLSNHITPQELQEMVQTEASSAEMAARRLVNFANIKGATDNATVVVLRAT